MKTLETVDTDFVKIPETIICIDLESGKKLSKGSGIAIKVLESGLPDSTCLEVRMFFPGTKRICIFDELYVKIPIQQKNRDQLLKVLSQINSGDFSRKMFLESFLIDLLFFTVIVEENGLSFFVHDHKPSKEQDLARSSLRHSSKHGNDTIGWLE